jgi:hypothetical protein
MYNDTFSGENPVFASYAFYSGLLILKMILMAVLTGFQRYKQKVKTFKRLERNESA